MCPFSQEHRRQYTFPSYIKETESSLSNPFNSFDTWRYLTLPSLPPTINTVDILGTIESGPASP